MFEFKNKPNETTAAQIAWVVNQFQKAEPALRRTIYDQLHSKDPEVMQAASEALFGFIEEASEQELRDFAKEQFGTSEIGFDVELYDPCRKLGEYFLIHLKKENDSYLIEPLDTLFYRRMRAAAA